MALSSFVLSMGLAACCGDRPDPQLRVGLASHAFDHLGAFADQAEAATASGANILYASGIGGEAYSGLSASFDAAIGRVKSYSDRARVLGASRIIGYLCATSIVGLDKFDAHWTKEFRARFKSPPREWLQRDARNMPLPSWYGGDYRPGCMNHPDWREYQRAMVASQLKAGQDGVFFDNPTVHNHGCYCDHCMRAFAAFLSTGHQSKVGTSPSELRSLAQRDRSREFAVFRTTIARDFLAEMRRFARTIRPDAWITANNSLNSPSAFYSQSKLYGYSIYEMSKAEDFVVVEDMETQPRLLETGKVVEYGPTYRQISAISHRKPVVAVTIAAGDYHTPARLVRLAMAESAAHGASYLSWPTWPESERARMIETIRPQTDFLRKHADLFNDVTPVEDVLVFLPMRAWLDNDRCPVSPLVAELTRRNVCYGVFCEDDFSLERLAPPGVRKPALLLTSREVCTPAEAKILAEFERSGGKVVIADAIDWPVRLDQAVGAHSLRVTSSPHVRCVVTRQPGRAIIHLYNLGIRRRSSFEDELIPAGQISLDFRVPMKRINNVRLLTADESPTSQDHRVERQPGDAGSVVQLRIAQLRISALVVIEGE